jgi:hypothetical protein
VEQLTRKGDNCEDILGYSGEGHIKKAEDKEEIRVQGYDSLSDVKLLL